MKLQVRAERAAYCVTLAQRYYAGAPIDEVLRQKDPRPKNMYAAFARTCDLTISIRIRLRRPSRE